MPWPHARVMLSLFIPRKEGNSLMPVARPSLFSLRLFRIRTLNHQFRIDATVSSNVHTVTIHQRIRTLFCLVVSMQ